MKKYLLIIPLLLLALISCDKKDNSNSPDSPVTPPDTTENPPVVTNNVIALTYDSTNVTVTAIPGDSVETYVLQVWLVEDYILDYGDDFTDAGVRNALASYLDMCIDWQMQFPIFDMTETTLVYDWFDQPYYGVEHIAMAASYNEQARKIDGPVSFIRFMVPEKEH
ncbi:MAG: hypothetical protein MJ002_04255 [Paludibacteraceae bacterium]|nr:hypothetical protein [Paludibacteraceae bacterium]